MVILESSSQDRNIYVFTLILPVLCSPALPPIRAVWNWKNVVICGLIIQFVILTEGPYNSIYVQEFCWRFRMVGLLGFRMKRLQGFDSIVANLDCHSRKKLHTASYECLTIRKDCLTIFNFISLQLSMLSDSEVESILIHRSRSIFAVPLVNYWQQLKMYLESLVYI